MILTLTPNPALDVTYHLESLPLGGVARVAAPALRAGGKGVNVARVLVGEGVAAHVVTTAGGPSGDAFAEDLARAEPAIPHTLVPVAAETRRTVVLAETDRTTLLNETGTALAEAELHALMQAVRAAAGETLVISGSLPPSFPVEELATLVAEARAAGRRTLVDTSGPALLAACRAGASLVKPNRAELVETTGTDDLLRGARALLAEGAEMVVVSDGERGLVAVGHGLVLRARPDRVLAGNATGAGDAALAALACAAPGEELAVSIARAVRWSARAVTHPLAGSLGKVEVDTVVDQMKEDPCP